MKGRPLGLSREDITWPDQVACWSRRTPGTPKIKPQNANRKSCANLTNLLVS